MNKERRKEISKVHAILTKLHAVVEDVLSQEEEAHDNLPESMQFNSQRSDDMQQAIADLEYLASVLEDAYNDIPEDWLVDVKQRDLVDLIWAV